MHLDAQKAELERLGFRIQEASDSRLLAICTRFHWDSVFTFVSYLAVVVRVRELTAAQLRSDRTQYLKLARKLDRNLLPRGMQKGRAVIVAYVADRATVEARELCESMSRMRFATFFVPAVLDLNAQHAFYNTGFRLWGALYLRKLRFLVQRLLEPHAAGAGRWPTSWFGIVLTVLLTAMMLSAVAKTPAWLGVRLLPVRAAVVPGTMGATALFAGPTGFCAMVDEQPRCWSSSPYESSTVRTIEGLSSPRTLAMRSSDTCALDEQSVKCWLTSAPTPVAVEGTHGATELIAVEEHYCALAHGQVRCWRGHGHKPETITGLKHVRRLLASLTGLSFCAQDDDGLKCFRYRANDTPPVYEPTFWLSGVAEPAAVAADEFAYRIIVLDQGRLLVHYDVGRGELHTSGNRRRRTFDGPLALKLLQGFKAPRALSHGSIYTYALDDEGVKTVDPGGRSAEADLSLPGGARVRIDNGSDRNAVLLGEPKQPSAIWAGPGSYVFSRDEQGSTVLRCSGWRKGKRDSFVVKGLVDPRQVAHGLEQACALEAGEVKCWSLRALRP